MIVMNEVPISYAANVTEMVNVSTHSNNHFPNTTIHNFFFLVFYRSKQMWHNWIYKAQESLNKVPKK